MIYLIKGYMSSTTTIENTPELTNICITALKSQINLDAKLAYKY